jgi:hypothetical protein
LSDGDGCSQHTRCDEQFVARPLLDPILFT